MVIEMLLNNDIKKKFIQMILRSKENKCNLSTLLKLLKK
jgi:hypothetical protein